MFPQLCLFPSDRMGKHLLTCAASKEMYFCQCSWKQWLQRSFELSAKSAPASPRAGARTGQEYMMAAGRMLSCHWVSSSGYDFTWCWVLTRKSNQVLLLNLSIPSHTLLPHSPWDSSSSQIIVGQINSENWPTGNLTLHVSKYANKRTVRYQKCQRLSWAGSP